MASDRIKCALCGGTRLRYSHSGLARWPAMLIFLRPIRCSECRARFWRFGGLDSHRSSGRNSRSRDSLRRSTAELPEPSDTSR